MANETSEIISVTAAVTFAIVLGLMVFIALRPSKRMIARRASIVLIAFFLGLTILFGFPVLDPIYSLKLSSQERISHDNHKPETSYANLGTIPIPDTIQTLYSIKSRRPIAHIYQDNINENNIENIVFYVKYFKNESTRIQIHRSKFDPINGLVSPVRVTDDFGDIITSNSEPSAIDLSDASLYDIRNTIETRKYASIDRRNGHKYFISTIPSILSMAIDKKLQN